MARVLRNVGAMQRFRIRIDDSQLRQIQGFLSGMSLGLQSDILAHAFAYAGKPIVGAARGYATVIADTGLLAKSLGCIVKRNRRTKEPYALITARGGYRKEVVRKDGRRQVANPQKYLHLVELGTRHSRPHRILERAIEARGAEAADRVMRGVERATDAQIKKHERKLTRTIIPRTKR